MRVRCERDDLRQPDILEAERECTTGSLAGISVAPGPPGQPPADLDSRHEMCRKPRPRQPGKADELTRLGDLQRPQAKAELVELSLYPIDHRGAVRADERARKVLHDLGVGVQGGERIAISLQNGLVRPSEAGVIWAVV